MRFIIVTGMSGAGKSTVLKALEDMDYFCVDNLPVMLIKKFAEISSDSNFKNDKVAIGIDIRSGEALGELSTMLSYLREDKFTYEIIYLDATDQAFVAIRQAVDQDSLEGILIGGKVDPVFKRNIK